MPAWLGVDIGGTFTDLVVLDTETHDVRAAKGPSSPSPEEGVLELVEAHVERGDLERSPWFLHGTTVGLNTLIERTGARVGMLVTDGFRDVLEIRRGTREAHDDPMWTPDAPLVPRRLRLPVPERTLADGTIETPIDLGAVRDAAARFAGAGVECAAVAFLHAYANPEHELAAERALRDAGFAGDVSLSHRVSREYREYERTSTTVIDAYLRPRVGRYLAELEAGLRRLGFGGTCLVMASGGGAMTFAAAIERPFACIQAGPVAGVVGTAALCRELGLPTAVAADVGGTSFDTCVVSGGAYDVRYEGRVIGMPLQAPWVDVASIGAGGGSIAEVDAGGLLRVGPRSAGAVPGPACYGRGGDRPTVTDAAMVLGMLPRDELAGGTALDADRARAALARIAEPLAVDVEQAAASVLRLLATSMADAIREVTLARGQDPREGTLVMYGGAGPLFGTLLAEELGVDEVVIPVFAGNFSAFGLLVGDVVQSSSRTLLRSLTAASVDALDAALRELFAEHGAARSRGAATGEGTEEALLDLRNVGQNYAFTVPVPWAGDAIGAPPEAIVEAFGRAYRDRFGNEVSTDVEVVSVRATHRSALPGRPRRELAAGDGADPLAGAPSADVHSFAHGRRAAFRVLERSALAAGARVEEPCVVREAETTTYVDAGFALRVDPTGALLLSRQAA